MVGDGIIHVQFDGDGLAFLIAAVAATMFLVKVLEQSLPGFPGS